MSRIESLTAIVHRVPLGRPWGPDVASVHLVVARVTDSDGHRGTGFTWTPSIGAGAIQSLLVQDCAQVVVGGATAPEVVWDRLWRHLHEAGSGGITTLAMAAVDTALWDLRGVAARSSLVDLLGRRREDVPVYGSGVNLHYSIDELEEQARRWVASGVTGAKVKVGKAELEEDLERVAVVRKVLGARRRLMVDANQRWDLMTARRAVRRLKRFDLHWVEEPLLSDDLRAHAVLRRDVGVPIALGENLHTVYQFREALLLGACDIVQPNVVRVGGITPFLRIAEMSRAAGASLAPHLLPDLSGQLALCLPEEVWVEDVEDASFGALGILAHPDGVVIEAGRFRANTGPGLGLALAVPGE